MDPLVLEYLKKQRQQDTQDTSADEILAANKKDQRLKQIAALTNLGESLGGTLSGRPVTGAAGKAIEVLAGNAQPLEARIKAAAASRKLQDEEMSAKRQAELTDPTSASSRTAQNLAKKLFGDNLKDEDISQISAADSELFFKPLQLKEQIEARKEQARILSGERKDKQAQLDLDRKESRLAKGAQNLSQRLEKSGLSELEPAAKMAEEVIAQKGNIEGFDPVRNTVSKLPFGQAAVNAFDKLIGSKGVDNRQKVQELQNLILRARSGGAVTPTEADRLLNSIGTAAGQGDEELRRGIKMVVGELKNKAGGILAGYPEDVKEVYEAQGGTLPRFNEGKPAPHGQRVKQNGRTFIWDGNKYVAE